MPLPSEPGAPSYGLLPFPPLPAVLLLPFVAVFGLATDDQLLGAVLGAINVGLCWRMLSRLTERNSVAVLATLLAFGTVAWYAAMLATTWFLAHLVALTFVLLGITLALDADRREQLRGTLARLTATPIRRPTTATRSWPRSKRAASSSPGAGGFAPTSTACSSSPDCSSASPRWPG